MIDFGDILQIIGMIFRFLGKDLAPENADEFDKLVLTSPDSSLCWIQYIAFHMERKEYSLAREVVKRALEKINFREETERFNIYMAWFNLENNFGTVLTVSYEFFVIFI